MAAALVVVAVALVGGVAMVGRGDDGPPAAGEVTALGRAFRPAEISVEPGEAVSLTNDDSIAHTFTADGGLFDSGEVAPGGTFRWSSGEERTIAFHCELHPTMKGTIVVGEGGQQ